MASPGRPARGQPSRSWVRMKAVAVPVSFASVSSVQRRSRPLDDVPEAVTIRLRASAPLGIPSASRLGEPGLCGSASDLPGAGVVIAALIGQPPVRGVYADEFAGVIPDIAAAIPITVPGRIAATAAVNGDRRAGPQSQRSEAIRMPVGVGDPPAAQLPGGPAGVLQPDELGIEALVGGRVRAGRVVVDPADADRRRRPRGDQQPRLPVAQRERDTGDRQRRGEVRAAATAARRDAEGGASAAVKQDDV